MSLQQSNFFSATKCVWFYNRRQKVGGRRKHGKNFFGFLLITTCRLFSLFMIIPPSLWNPDVPCFTIRSMHKL